MSTFSIYSYEGKLLLLVVLSPNLVKNVLALSRSPSVLSSKIGLFDTQNSVKKVRRVKTNYLFH